MALDAIPPLQTGDGFRDRALMDLINAEREMRRMAENGSTQMRKLLHTLAFRLAGAQMEELRKTSPNAPDNWKVEDWLRFFNQHVLPSLNSGANAGWQSSINLSALQDEMQALRDQVDKEKGRNAEMVKDLQSRDAEIASRDQLIAGLQRQLTQYRTDLAQSQAALSQLQQAQNDDPSDFPAGDLASLALLGEAPSIPENIAKPPADPISAETYAWDGIRGQTSLPAEGGSVSVAPAAPAHSQSGATQVSPTAAEGGKSKYSGPAFVEEARFKQMVQTLTSWQTPRIPERYRLRLEMGLSSETKARRHSMILFLVSRYGLSTNLEIDRVIAAAEGVRMRSNSVKAPLGELVKGGFLVQETLALKEPFSTSLVCLRLSEDGKNLCRIWGWEPVESDWERIIRLHQGDRPENREHTLGILIFAMHARFRGWTVEILPDVSSPTRPDLAVLKQGELYFVEFENSSNGEKSQKWRNIAALHPQHKVGICTFTEEERTRHAHDCILLRISGVAADLKSLIFQNPETREPRPIDDISSEHDLWRHRW